MASEVPKGGAGNSLRQALTRVVVGSAERDRAAATGGNGGVALGAGTGKANSHVAHP